MLQWTVTAHSGADTRGKDPRTQYAHRIDWSALRVRSGAAAGDGLGRPVQSAVTVNGDLPPRVPDPRPRASSAARFRRTPLACKMAGGGGESVDRVQCCMDTPCRACGFTLLWQLVQTARGDTGESGVPLSATPTAADMALRRPRSQSPGVHAPGSAVCASAEDKENVRAGAGGGRQGGGTPLPAIRPHQAEQHALPPRAASLQSAR